MVAVGVVIGVGVGVVSLRPGAMQRPRAKLGSRSPLEWETRGRSDGLSHATGRLGDGWRGGSRSGGDERRLHRGRSKQRRRYDRRCRGAIEDLGGLRRGRAAAQRSGFSASAAIHVGIPKLLLDDLGFDPLFRQFTANALILNAKVFPLLFASLDLFLQEDTSFDGHVVLELQILQG